MAILDYQQEEEAAKALLKEYKDRAQTIWNQQEKEIRQRLKSGEEAEEDCFQIYNSGDLVPRAEKGNGKIKILKFERASYAFAYFKGIRFGKTSAFSEKEMYRVKVNFRNTVFEDCTFENVFFEHSGFFGCKFLGCRTEGTGMVFENCTFTNTRNELIENEYVVGRTSVQFTRCLLGNTRFRKCSLENSIFEESVLDAAEWVECDLKAAIMSGNRFSSACIRNTNIENVKIIGSQELDLEFYGAHPKSSLNRSIFIGKLDLTGLRGKDAWKKTARKEQYGNLAKLYYTLSKCLKINNLNTVYLKEYRFLYNWYSMLAKDRLMSKLWDFFSWAVCGFGEKINRFIVWMLGIIIVPAFSYLFSGLQVGDRVIQYRLTDGSLKNTVQLAKDLVQCVHFSIVTFSTVGYGNIIPYGVASCVISAVQILLGILFVAILTSIVVQRILR